MRRFSVVFRMDLTNLFKNPVLIGYNTVFTVLIIVLMSFLSGGDYSEGRHASQYYVVTLTVYAMLNGAMTASNCFMERDIRRPNLRILYSPAGSFSVWFSKLLSSFLFDYSLHALLLSALCPLLHVTLGDNPALFLLLMAPVEFAAAALGVFFCCVFHCEETTSMLLSLSVNLLCVLGGTFFSLDSLGGAFAAASRLSPVRWIDEAFFMLSCDGNAALFWPVFLGASAVSALLVLGCRLLFRSEDYL